MNTDQEIITTEQQREQIINNIADAMRRTPFTFEFRVKEKPKGIKIVYEISQADMDAMLKQPMEDAHEREKQRFMDALKRCSSHKAAADWLGISDRTFYRKAKEYGLM